MNINLPLDRMTMAEKLSAMEALWQDLSRDAGQFESPAWHGDVLRERDQRVKEGKESYVDWKAAKKDLRKRQRGKSRSSRPPSRTWPWAAPCGKLFGSCPREQGGRALG